MFEYVMSLVGRKLGRFRIFAKLLEPLRIMYANKYKKGNSTIVVKDVDGDLTFKLNRSKYIGSRIYWTGYHSASEIKLLKRILRPNYIFADIGANQGEFTIHAARMLSAGNVLSFEPVTNTFNLLEENILLNNFSNVHTYKLALSNEKGRRNLFSSDKCAFHGSENEGLVSLYESNVFNKGVEEVEVDTFDNIFQESNLDRLDVMKIDVEGAEFEVLRGARKTITKYKPEVIIEINKMHYASAGHNDLDVVQYFTTLGYNMYAIKRWGFKKLSSESILPSHFNALFSIDNK